ncbi:type IV secretory pathway protein AcvB [Rhodospirillum rubrum]|uniref:virulence factor family protein n=1 Tax=Rhodospirillum rubrum TaxID=1085 RepID=UPI001905FAE2|nr:virulence factor family protein [Rhodospirillum rubrum]MBK1663861.1 type IV secretory pathway protein AcvB [Rhodospirillum rubrum]MBK1675895.1 type IV secretory pathway protein AcvB [Rhodospirillum rubrum]
MIRLRIIVPLIALALLGIGYAVPHAKQFTTGSLPDPKIEMPKGPQNALVVLISDAQGWSDADARLSARLKDSGSVVIGIDLPRYLAVLEKAPEDCVYLVGDIEELSQEVQKAAGGAAYVLPVIAGSGEGADLALAMAAQTPDATIGHTLAVDPTGGLPLKKILCTDAPHRATPAGIAYGLQSGPLPNPIDTLFTPAAPAPGRDHVASLRETWGAITAGETAQPAKAALESALMALLTDPSAKTKDAWATELPTTATRDTLAIVYSGDGGWRDLDKQIADEFQKRGVPTLGVDSLRAFWSRKTPEETAKTLSRLINTYTRRWQVNKVLLVGYSFGADILPATLAALPEADRARITQISLLGFSTGANFEISVTGWFGAKHGETQPTLPDLAKLDPAQIQCFYGLEEDDSACPKLKDSGIEILSTTGGHHFDGDYKALATRILAGLDRRAALAEAEGK